MFLDDQLIEIVENAVINSAQDISVVRVGVVDACLNNIRKKVEKYNDKDVPKSILRIWVSQVECLYNSFLQRGTKHKSHTVNTLVKYFKQHPFSYWVEGTILDF